MLPLPPPSPPRSHAHPCTCLPCGRARACRYAKLFRQAASYELSEGEVRQLLFDLESSYNEFIATIR